jgi:HK97 family phage prohead protease
MHDAICLRAVEFHATADTGDGRTLEGYAAVFDTPARIQSWDGEFDEEIVRGAFRKTIRARTPVLQFDHGRDMRTGSVPIGSVDELNEDEQGLFVRAPLFDNPVVEPIRQAIAGGAISGMSIRFQVSRDKWTDNDGKEIKDDELAKLMWEPGDRGPLKRSILEIDPLFELGPVVFPAYDSTTVGVRSLLAQLDVDERRLLVRELAADLKNIPDFTGQPGARSAGGGDESGPQPGNGSGPPSLDPAIHSRVLRVLTGERNARH